MPDLDRSPEPVDVAVDPSGRTFVAERAGPSIFDQDGASSGGDSVDSLSSSRDDGSVVLSIALAPDFAESHFVYALKIEAAAGQSRALLVRVREVDGRLGQAAVIARAIHRYRSGRRDPLRSRRRAVCGARLAIDRCGGIARVARRRPILRLLPDGRHHATTRGRHPYSSGHRDPSGFVWLRAGAFMKSRAASRRMRSTRSGPARLRMATVNRRPVRRHLVADGAVARGHASFRDDPVNDRQSPLDGDLIVSSIGLDDLLRIRMTPDGRPTAEEPVRLLQGRFGADPASHRRASALVFVTAIAKHGARGTTSSSGSRSGRASAFRRKLTRSEAADVTNATIG